VLLLVVAATVTTTNWSRPLPIYGLLHAEAELAGLEPATSWVRYQALAADSALEDGDYQGIREQLPESLSRQIRSDSDTPGRRVPEATD
jgi:hypothetical protein